MADSKFSALPGVSSIAGAEEFAVNNAGASEKATGTQVSAYVETRLQQGVVCSKSSAQTITSGSWTDLVWGAESFKVGDTGIHSTSSDSERMTAKVAGEYLPVGSISFDADAADFVVGVQLYKNGSAIMARAYSRTLQAASFGVGVAVPPVPLQLSVDDYVTCRVWHNKGSGYDVLVNHSRFGMYLLGR
jgi:hypothetical protein